MGFSQLAKLYIGVKEYSNKHMEIVNEYNRIKPLPRGYKVSYTDPWCAVYVSFIMSNFKCINPPYECSADNMYRLCKEHNQLVSTPSKDCIIFYSWKCNGFINHVGIVESVNGDTITTIEGNVSNTVKRRTIKKSYIYIAGYAKIKTKSETKTKDNNIIAKEVIAGKWGNGEERKQKLTNAGYNYKEVQNIVNKMLKG